MYTYIRLRARFRRARKPHVSILYIFSIFSLFCEFSLFSSFSSVCSDCSFIFFRLFCLSFFSFVSSLIFRFHFLPDPQYLTFENLISICGFCKITFGFERVCFGMLQLVKLWTHAQVEAEAKKWQVATIWTLEKSKVAPKAVDVKTQLNSSKSNRIRLTVVGLGWRFQRMLL